MRPLLHIPDGFLAPRLALALWVATAAIVGFALRRLSASSDEASAAQRPILMGIVGAFIFAAQLFNFPVAAGTSGHLLGGVLAGYLLGPWAGTIVMTSVIGIQALLFQDGGVLALGANIFNMGVIGTLGGSFVARGIGATLGGTRIATLIGVGAAAWLSVVAAAGFTTLQLGLSGTTELILFLGFMAAFAIKAPLFPLHGWLPQAYRESPPEVAAVLSGVVSKTAVYGFLRIGIYHFSVPMHDIANAALALAAVGLVYGSVVAFRQPDLRAIGEARSARGLP